MVAEGPTTRSESRKDASYQFRVIEDEKGVAVSVGCCACVSTKLTSRKAPSVLVFPQLFYLLLQESGEGCRRS